VFTQNIGENRIEQNLGFFRTAYFSFLYLGFRLLNRRWRDGHQLDAFPGEQLGSVEVAQEGPLILFFEKPQRIVFPINRADLEERRVRENSALIILALKSIPLKTHLQEFPRRSRRSTF
jgi:hypothetical protein